VLGRALRGGICATFAALTLAAPASGQSAPFAPYDGSNPFNCVLQDAGTGTEVPDPAADPYCVEFDKTSQSLLPDAGLVDFLLNEPGRVAAASPKCFYYQRDHWTGALVQGQPPELWHWDGGYFFDKARGTGGVSVRNFRVLGEPGDMTPFVPPAYQPYFDSSGGGGVQFTGVADADPACVARVDTPEEREQVYRNTPVFPDCIPPGGELRRRRVGQVRLGLARGEVIARLGEPHRRKRRTDRWCLIGDARLKIAYESKRAALITTSSRGHTEKGVGPGTKLGRAKNRLDLQHRFDLGRKKVFEAPVRHDRRLFAAVRRRRILYLAMADPAALGSLNAIERALRRTR
jgi:hypothetical protein